MARRGYHEGTRGQRPDGRFFNAVRLGGRRKYFYGRTQAEADKQAREARRKFEQGLRADGGDRLLADYLADWLETVVRHKRPNTYTNYEVAVRVHIAPRPASRPLGRLRLAQLQPEHIEAWLADRLDAGLRPTTVRRLHAVLRAALNRAVRADLIARNPAARAEPVHVDEEEVQPLSAEAARLVLAATRGRRDHALYAVALSSGLRIGELLGLRWRDVELEERQLRVRSQMQSGRISPLKQTWHRRSITLSAWLVTVLEAHADLLRERRRAAGGRWVERDLVFPTERGTPQRASNTWAAWQRLQRKLGLEPTKFHNLRHTAASLALQAGVPLWKVSKMLGHRDVAITFRVYSHLTPEGQEDIAERMEGVLAREPRPRAVDEEDVKQVVIDADYLPKLNSGL